MNLVKHDLDHHEFLRSPMERAPALCPRGYGFDSSLVVRFLSKSQGNNLKTLHLSHFTAERIYRIFPY